MHHMYLRIVFIFGYNTTTEIEDNYSAVMKSAKTLCDNAVQKQNSLLRGTQIRCIVPVLGRRDL
jgi:hypothetical protein